MPGTPEKKHEWLFVLLNKDTPSAAWWLKITTLPDLLRYLEQTNTRWAHVFDNYLHDSEFQAGAVGHGKHIKEAGLTQMVYYRAVHEQKSMLQTISDVAGELTENMADALYVHGRLYVNCNGGWNIGGKGLDESGSFCRRERLVWPGFTESDIKISRFPGGRHWYAYVGNVQVRDRDNLKFSTREEAMRQARLYITC